MREEAGAAVEQVGSGHPGRIGRRLLAAVAVAAAGLWMLDTIAVVNGALLRFDVPAELAVQRVPWGPYARLMDATNFFGGAYQTGLALAAVVGLFIWDRRGGLLMLLGMGASLIDQVVKASVARHRPEASLVRILDPANGYSYPSGHAVFYTWLAFMLAAAIAPGVTRRTRWMVWSAAALLALTGCLGRVYAGVHWPSDVLGGFLLGLGWSAFVLWLPERLLPAPAPGWRPWPRL